MGRIFDTASKWAGWGALFLIGLTVIVTFTIPDLLPKRTTFGGGDTLPASFLNEMLTTNIHDGDLDANFHYSRIDLQEHTVGAPPAEQLPLVRGGNLGGRSINVATPACSIVDNPMRYFTVGALLCENVDSADAGWIDIPRLGTDPATAPSIYRVQQTRPLFLRPATEARNLQFEATVWPSHISSGHIFKGGLRMAVTTELDDVSYANYDTENIAYLTCDPTNDAGQIVGSGLQLGMYGVCRSTCSERPDCGIDNPCHAYYKWQARISSRDGAYIPDTAVGYTVQSATIYECDGGALHD